MRFLRAICLTVFTIVLLAAIGYGITITLSRNQQPEEFRFQVPVKYKQSGGGVVNITGKLVGVAGFGNRFLVFVESKKGITAVEVKTQLPLIQAYGLSADRANIVYETPDPYRTVVENLATGELRTLGQTLGSFDTVVSPVRNEAVMRTLQADAHGNTINGLAYINLDTGDEQLLVDQNVSGPITWNAEGSKVYFYMAKRIDLSEPNPRASEVGNSSETSYLPMSVSLDSLLVSAEASESLPNTVPRYKKEEHIVLDTLRLTDSSAQSGENSVARSRAIFMSTPDGHLELSSESDSTLMSMIVTNRATGDAKTLPQAEGATLVATTNKGVIVRQIRKEGPSSEETIGLGFIDWAGNTTNLPATVTVNYNLPLRSSTVSQVGVGYSPYCGYVNHSGSLAYAYDFAGAYRSHVLASAKGRVVLVSNGVNCARSSNCRAPDDPYRSGCSGSDWGNHIIVRHDDLRRTLYAHLTSNSMKVSTDPCSSAFRDVCQGQYIADQGHTGYIISSNCGDHLHHQLMAANESNPGAITASISITYSGAPNPLRCTSYTSLSNEIPSCPGGISIYASPSPVIISRGARPIFYVYASALSGFRGSVCLNAFNLPGNLVLPGTGFSPQILDVAADNTWYLSTFTLVTNSSTPRGTFDITFQGRSGTKTGQSTVRLIVQ